MIDRGAGAGLSLHVVVQPVIRQIVVQHHGRIRVGDRRGRGRRRRRRVGRLLEVRQLVDDGDVAYGGPPAAPAVLVGRRHHRRPRLGQELRPGDHDDDGPEGRGHQDREDAEHEGDVGVAHLLLVLEVDLAEGRRTQGRLDRGLGHARQGDEDLLLEVEPRADAHGYGRQDAQDYAEEQAARADVDRVAVELGYPDLRAGHAEEDGLEDHPEDLEGCRHWVLGKEKERRVRRDEYFEAERGFVRVCTSARSAGCIIDYTAGAYGLICTEFRVVRRGDSQANFSTPLGGFSNVS